MSTTMVRFRIATRAALVVSIAMMLALTSSCGGTTAPSGTSAQPAATAATAGQPAGASPTAAATTAEPSPQAGASQPATGDGTQAPSGTAAAPASGTSGTGAAGTSEAPQTATPAPTGQTAPATVMRTIGEIVFTEGSVTIQRAGAAPERADIGSVVHAYDVLATGPKSRAEIDLGSGSAGGATVKLAQNTAFYFDTKELSDAQRQTVVQLLSGALAVKVDRLANGSFQIGTDQAVLGVRGTVFFVDTIPDGSLLVTCGSGAVEVTDGSTKTTAKPGGVVELTQAGGLKLLAVADEELVKYRGDWLTDANKSFASRALSYTSAYAAAIDAGKPAFDAALARLQTQNATLDAWRAAKAAGKEPRFTDWIAEKKTVSAALFDCLKALFALERPYYRLVELKTLHDAGTGVGALKDGRLSTAYFSGFGASTASLSLGMARVREALMLFSWVSAGSPLGEFFGSKVESLGTGALFLE